MQYVEFDGVDLPLLEHEQDHDPMAAESTLLDSVGGAFDWYGSARRPGRKQSIALQGVFVGESSMLVDDLGNFLVDDLGNFFIDGSPQNIMRAAVSALVALVGVRGPLWRKRLDDNVREWKTARLLALAWPRKVDNHALVAEVSCRLETSMEFWHAATATSTSTSATAALPVGLQVGNGGTAPVDDATLTITRTSGTITRVDIVCVAAGVDLTWTGSIGASQALLLDDGAKTVRVGSVDSYSGLVRNVGHTARGWLPLALGEALWTITVTGGNATVAFSHYNQFG